MRLVVYDATIGGLLGAALAASARVLSWLGWYDDVAAAESWCGVENACLSSAARLGRLDRIEYWGHGYVGGAMCAGEPLDAANWPGLGRIGRCIAPDGLLWWRTCSSFAAPVGQVFAEQSALRCGRRVAGHTHVIWLWQSGMHVLRPGWAASWSVEEGGGWSWPWSPNTVFCLSRGPR